jgi:hypothetical protein
MTGIPPKPNALAGLFRAAFGSTGTPTGPTPASASPPTPPQETLPDTVEISRERKPHPNARAELLLEKIFALLNTQQNPALKDFTALFPYVEGKTPPEKWKALQQLYPDNKAWLNAMDFVMQPHEAKEMGGSV